jgi:hypothetical protein
MIFTCLAGNTRPSPIRWLLQILRHFGLLQHGPSPHKLAPASAARSEQQRSGLGIEVQQAGIARFASDSCQERM